MSVVHGIKSLGVIGAGQMGTFDDHHTALLGVVILFQGLGIAYVAALRAKVSVQLYDRSSDQVTKGLSLMDKLLAKDVAKGKIQEADARQARERVSVVDRAVGVRALRDTDMVIEAVSENLEVKQRIFSELAVETRPDTILATNTSSISITKIASSAVPQGESAASALGKSSAGRVVGLHFFNPVPVMKLVELISALQTSDETLSRARSFAIACDKEVTVSKDVPGFVSNALLMPFINEAIMWLEKGVATRDDIDKTLRLADFIGLDTCLAIQQTLYAGTGDSKYRPSVLLERMVDAQWLGRKNGKGFYEYND
ncbi:3-hydroxyacyl-CoA dehydrogenase [Lactarius psammicola]|nr:3-hydroxyacyl-CoA dehydrogenase [Lactarius psammicola]